MDNMQKVYDAFLKAHAAGDKKNASVLADYIRQQQMRPVEAPIQLGLPEATTKQAEGFLPSLKEGVIGTTQSTIRGVTAPFQSDEEIRAAYEAQKAEEAKRNVGYTPFAAIPEAFQKEGLGAAAETTYKAIRDAAGRSLPAMVPTVGGSAMGAYLGTFGGPAAPITVPAGAIIGGVLSSTPMFAGTNIERRIEEKTPGPLVTPEVYTTGFGQAALDEAAAALTLGTSVVSRIARRPIGKVTEPHLVRLAEESLLKTTGKGGLRGMASEMPTEVAQQILERKQAGLDLTSEDALREYGEAAAAAGVIGGGLGGIGNIHARSVARDKLTQIQERRDAELATINAERQRIANIAKTAQQAELARIQAADKALADREAELRKPLTKQMELDLAPETTIEDVAAKRTAESPQGDLFAGMPEAPTTPAFSLDDDTIKSFGFRKNTAAQRALSSINDPAMPMNEKIKLYDTVMHENLVERPDGKQPKIVTPEQADAIEKFRRFLEEHKAKENQDALLRTTPEYTADRDGVQALGERGGVEPTEGAASDLTGAVGTAGVDVGQPVGRAGEQYAPLEAAPEAQAPESTEVIQPEAMAVEPVEEPVVQRLTPEERQQRIVQQRAEEEAARRAEKEANLAAAKAEQAPYRESTESILPAEQEGLQAAKEFDEGDVDMSIGRRTTPEEDLTDQAIKRVIEREKLGYDVWTGDTAKGEHIASTVKKLITKFDSGKINPDQLADQLGFLHDRIRRKSLIKKYEGRERVRGADFIRERLLRAKRHGEITEEASDFAEWFINKNPKLVEDLGISIRSSERSAAGNMAAGYYNELGKIMTLINGTDSSTTSVHEILHHLEKMMPEDIQQAIRKAWLQQATKARAKETNPEWVKYFDHVLSNERNAAIKVIEKLGDPTEQYYKFLNPSEFWAVHATDIMHNRFNVDKSISGKIKNWLREFIEKAKSVFGLDSTAPMIKALNDLLADQAPVERSAKMLGRQKPEELSASIRSEDTTGDNIFRDLVQPRVADARLNLGAAVRAITPKLLSMYQLVDQFGQEMPSLQTYSELNDKMTMTQQRLKNKAHTLLADWGSFAFKHPAQHKKLGTLMLDATRTKIHPDEAIDAEPNAHLTEEDAAKYEELSNTYNSLTPEAKQIYQRARAMLQENFELRRTIYNDMVRGAYAEDLAEATPEEAEKINARVDKAIQEHELLLNQMRGPYFPLMRFGEYLVVAESNELRELRDQLAESTGAERKRLIQMLRQMEQSDEHYSVYAFDKRSEQAREAAKQKNQGMNVRETKSEEYMNNIRANSFGAIDQLEKIFDREIDLDIDPAQVRQLRQSMIDSVLAGLPENSALQRQIKRRNIAGASENMLQAFAETMERDSHYLSRMGYMKPLSKSLIDMRNQSKNDMQLRDVYNNVRARLNLDTKYDQHPILSKLTGFSSIYHLGIAPSYLLQNMTQPFMITIPQLAGRYGVKNTSKAVISAWGDARKAVTGGRNGKFFSLKDTDLDKAFAGGELKMVKLLQDLGKLDIANNMDTEVYTKGMSPKTIKFWQMFNWSSHNIELMNRLSTALAAYRLEMKKTGSEEAATKAAREAIELTQLDYSDTNAAYFMKQGHMGGLNRLPMQFRKYQQGMIYLLARNFKNAWGGDAEAKKAFLYLLGTQLLMAGVRGVPVAAPLIFLLGMFGDKDDKEGDLETQLRNGLADTFGPETARVFWKGLPAMMGVDSGSMSMENLFLPFPMMRSSAITDAATGKDAVTELMFNLGGAPVSMASRIMDAYLLASEGDFQKASEKALPKFISSLVKAERLGSEGLTTRSGNVAIEADEFSAWDQTIKALGFSPIKEAEYYQAMYEKERISDAIDNVRNKIIKSIATSRMNGENADDALEQLREFNAEHPTRRITGESITRSIAQRRKDRAQRAESGVRYEKRERDISDVTRFAD